MAKQRDRSAGILIGQYNSIHLLYRQYTGLKALCPLQKITLYYFLID